MVRSIRGLLATPRPVNLVRGGTLRLPTNTTIITCQRMKITVGTRTEVQDHGVTPWTQIYAGSSVMYQNVVNIFIIGHYINLYTPSIKGIGLLFPIVFSLFYFRSYSKMICYQLSHNLSIIQEKNI